MIIYFTGTGNSLVVARKLADKLGDSLIPLHDAVDCDLLGEKRIGLVYPTYMLDAPIAVRTLVPRLQLPKDAYVYIVITCGAQTNNAVWRVRKLLRDKEIEISYCNKVRFPDTAGLAYGRNPNDQVWKFKKYAPRIDAIVNDVAAEKHAFHYAGMDVLGCLLSTEAVSKQMYRGFIPVPNGEKCIGCGICARICPQANISVIDSKAKVGDKCTMCLGCVHFCPKQAMEVAGKETKPSYQYHHPDIKRDDLFRR